MEIDKFSNYDKDFEILDYYNEIMDYLLVCDGFEDSYNILDEPLFFMRKKIVLEFEKDLSFNELLYYWTNRAKEYFDEYYYASSNNERISMLKKCDKILKKNFQKQKTNNKVKDICDEFDMIPREEQDEMCL